MNIRELVDMKHGHNTYQRQVLAQIDVQLQALRRHLDDRRLRKPVENNPD